MQQNMLTGKLLLATPSLQDPNFAESVVLICHHDNNGSLGLVINRPQDITIAEVLRDLGFEYQPGHGSGDHPELQPVYAGGPVDTFRGFVLHDGWDVFESTMQITSELHLTASLDVLEAIASGRGPEHYLILLGYAGWGSGQLESELAANDWLVAPLSQRIIFHEPPEQRWNFGARCMGIDPAQLSDQVGHA